MNDNGKLLEKPTPIEEEEVTDPLLCLFYGVENHPEQVHLFPLMPVITDMARSNDKRPAYIKISVDDKMIVNIKGDSDKTHLYMLVAIERSVVDEASAVVKEIDSPIEKVDMIA